MLHDIRDHGAVGDGETLDTAAIQAAVDACAAAGGGTVVLPAGGTYLAGTVTLRSFVELHVERGAVLQGSGDWADYTDRIPVGALSNGVVTESSAQAGMLLTALDAEGVAITGGGVIDGAGRAFVTGDDGTIYSMPNERPFTVFLRHCRNVTVRDVTLRDGALWTLRLSGCDDVLVHGIRIRNDLKLPNSDGIDLDRCRDVRISDCDIVSGDDGISLKTCEEFPDWGPTENVVVSNCTITSTSSALVVGVDAVAPIRNVVFTGCVIRSSNRAMSVNLGQAGDFENILFAHIVCETRLFGSGWWGHGEPVFVAVRPWQQEVGHLRNVRFVDVLARSESGVVVHGESPDHIRGLVLQDVRIELARTTSWPGNHQDLRPSPTLGIRAHPTSGIFVENATDVTIRDCEVSWGAPDPAEYRHVLETRAVDGLVVQGLRGESADPRRWPAVLDLPDPLPPGSGSGTT